MYKVNVLNVPMLFQEQSKTSQKSVKLSSLLDDSDDNYSEAGDSKSENKKKKKTEKDNVCILTFQLKYGGQSTLLIVFWFAQEGKSNKLAKGIKGKRKMKDDVDETNPLEYYEAVKLQKKMKKEAKKAAYR